MFGKRWKKCGLWKERGKVWSLERAGKSVVFGKRGKSVVFGKRRGYGVFRKREETYAAGNLDEIELKSWFYVISRPQALSLRGLIE